MAEHCYAECRVCWVFYAECHKEVLYSECRYDKCHGATLAYSVLHSNLYREKFYDIGNRCPHNCGLCFRLCTTGGTTQGQVTQEGGCNKLARSTKNGKIFYIKLVRPL